MFQNTLEKIKKIDKAQTVNVALATMFVVGLGYVSVRVTGCAQTSLAGHSWSRAAHSCCWAAWVA